MLEHPISEEWENLFEKESHIDSFFFEDDEIGEGFLYVILDNPGSETHEKILTDELEIFFDVPLLEDASDGILFKQTDRITHPSPSEAGDELECGFLRVDLLRLGDESETIDDISGPDTFEVIALSPGDNCIRDLVDLGRREDEFDVSWWLFEGLEESIKCSLGEHVDLVDDIDFVLGLRRLELGSFDDIADIINSRIGRRINLDDIKQFPLIKGTTVVTHPTWIPILGQSETIHSLGKDSRHTRFPCPP